MSLQHKNYLATPKGQAINTLPPTLAILMQQHTIELLAKLDITGARYKITTPNSKRLGWHKKAEGGWKVY